MQVTTSVTRVGLLPTFSYPTICTAEMVQFSGKVGVQPIRNCQKRRGICCIHSLPRLFHWGLMWFATGSWLRASSSITMTTHSYMHIRPRAPTMQAKSQPTPIVFTNIRGPKCNIDSVHQVLRCSSTLALFSTETQISPHQVPHACNFLVITSSLLLLPK